MSTCFTFLRHAQTDANASGVFSGKTDLPLNEEGKECALAAEMCIRDRDIPVLVGAASATQILKNGIHVKLDAEQMCIRDSLCNCAAGKGG